ncbi:MAG: phage terminase large subunit [Dehalococcoidia bacterium]|nr:phage terminase large subunit [Dehalococcoidia bacterium]
MSNDGSLKRRVGRLASETKRASDCDHGRATPEDARCPACRVVMPWARDAARDSLLPFVGITHRDYRPTAVHVAIAEALEAVERGEIERLLIEIPPRHGKSQLVSVHFPTWYLARHPDRRIIAASHTQRLANGFGRRARNLLSHPDFATVFPGVRVADDASAASEWNIEGRDGGYLAAGVGGGITGSGANVLIVDDPVKNRREADSVTYRETTWEWLNDVAQTRLEDPQAIVFSMTRWHLDDLAGRALDADLAGWTVLRLPAIAEAGDPLGREVGEALWPARYPLSRLEKVRASSVDFDALYQQHPVAREGATFRREWLAGLRYDAEDGGPANLCVGRWISVDSAMKDTISSDYTAVCVVEMLPDYRLLVREVYRERLQFPDLPGTIEAIGRRYNRDLKLRGVLIEDKGSGISALQTLRASAPDWLARMLLPFEPGGSKEYRASQAAVWVRNGCVLLPHPSEAVPWLADFEAELFAFPSAAHDDQVDSLVQAVLFLEHYVAQGFHARAEAYRVREVVPLSASKRAIDRLQHTRAG